MIQTVFAYSVSEIIGIVVLIKDTFRRMGLKMVVKKWAAA